MCVRAQDLVGFDERALTAFRTGFETSTAFEAKDFNPAVAEAGLGFAF